jgi:hypothetical protein
MLNQSVLKVFTLWQRKHVSEYFYTLEYFALTFINNISAYNKSTPVKTQGFELQECPYSMLCSPFKNGRILKYTLTYCWLISSLGALLKHRNKQTLLIKFMNLQWLEMYVVERMVFIRPLSASNSYIVMKTKERNYFFFFFFFALLFNFSPILTLGLA